jgi:hypothetical protein
VTQFTPRAGGDPAATALAHGPTGRAVEDASANEMFDGKAKQPPSA